MTALIRQFRDFFISLRLTVFLLGLSIILVFWATLAQTDLGVYGVQQKFFHSLFIMQKFPGTDFLFPVFPGGYFIGGLLFINLIIAQFSRFKLSWKKFGIWITHLGLIMLLVGELLSGLLQQDNDMVLDNGQTKNYAESMRQNEFVVTDVTDPKTDDVTSIPIDTVADLKTVQLPNIPFQIIPRTFYPNAAIANRTQAPNAPVSAATQGVGTQTVLMPLAETVKDNERNEPAALIELVGSEGSLGTWLVSADPAMPVQKFDYKGKTWKIAMRATHRYLPFSLTLVKFSHDVYQGTDIPKNFSSLVRINEENAKSSREVLIYMNNPLRTHGLTFYQSGFANQDRTAILQVVRNPSWQLPYIACLLMTAGLLFQFSIHLFGFFSRRKPEVSLT